MKTSIGFSQNGGAYLTLIPEDREERCLLAALVGLKVESYGLKWDDMLEGEPGYVRMHPTRCRGAAVRFVKEDQNARGNGR